MWLLQDEPPPSHMTIDNFMNNVLNGKISSVHWNGVHGKGEKNVETETQKDIKILAIESSCDETAASVVKNGRTILSNVISSQIDLHKLYGGVVPEIASRKHIEKINQVIEEALKEAGVTLDDLDAIGVTYGPGLVGALLVGVAEAKAISFAKDLPLVGVQWGGGSRAARGRRKGGHAQ